MIQFVGDAQAQLLSRLYARLIATRTGDRISYSRQITAPALPPSAPDLLIVQQANAVLPRQWVGHTQIIVFPLLVSRQLWPFAGSSEQGYRDLYLEHRYSHGLPAERIIADYLELNVADVVDLPALVDEDRQRQECLERLTGIPVPATASDRGVEQLFLAPRVPAPRLMAELAQATFARIGHEITIERIRSALRTEGRGFFFELPVHPSVASAVGASYLDSETAFVTRVGKQTFQHYARTYNPGEFFLDLLGVINEPAAEPILERARRLVAEGEVRQAEAALSQAITHLPDLPELSELLAELLFVQSKWRETIETAEHAALIAPDRDRIFRHAALAELAMGKPEAAEDFAQRALSLNPLEPTNRNILAEVLEALGRRAEAILTLEQGRTLGVRNDQSFSLLGNFYQRAGALDQAIKTFSEGCKLYPDRDDLAVCLGQILPPSAAEPS